MTKAFTLKGIKTKCQCRKERDNVKAEMPSLFLSFLSAIRYWGPKQRVRISFQTLKSHLGDHVIITYEEDMPSTANRQKTNNALLAV